MRLLVVPICLFTLMMATGCARYEYRILEPEAAAQTIAKEPRTTLIEPIEYLFAQRDGRLAVRITNPSDNVIRLVPNKSFAVTPAGETRPLYGGIIAPHSFIELNLPPVLPVYRVRSPFYGYGFGYHPRPGFGYDPFFDPFYGAPSYYYIVPPHDPAYYWSWKEGIGRFRFFYEIGDQDRRTLEHSLVIQRYRVK